MKWNNFTGHSWWGVKKVYKDKTGCWNQSDAYSYFAVCSSLMQSSVSK
jgi:hypothetical protein